VSFLGCVLGYFLKKETWCTQKGMLPVVTEKQQHHNDDGMPNDCGEVVDRRSGIDRRDLQPSSKDLNRRRGPGRRRTDFLRAAEEGEMTQEQFMFLLAINAFKEANGRTFPTWTDVLEVIRKLGYRKTLPSELDLGHRGADWTEEPDADGGV
jgi:hypothetical protein